MSANTLDDLPAVLARMSSEVDRTMGEALELGANMVVAEAKATHDYEDRSGTLTNSIQVEAIGVRGNLFATVIAAAPYALPIEEGSIAHDIVPKKRKALRLPLAGGYLFRRKVHHPGTKAVEFLAQALERKADAIETVFADALDLALARAGF